MLTLFNKKELLITMDLKRQAQVRNLLSENDIEYSFKTINLQGSEVRVRSGGLGISQAHSYEYRIYVNKKDFDKALYLIRSLV